MNFAVALLAAALRVLDIQPPRIVESVTVVEELPALTTPAPVTRVAGEQLATSAALTLDDTLRSVPGFSLFRRSSSRTANPTTQGVTLRGLAASGSSRALVLADDVPLNDPIGGWVYWNRVPAAALADVAVARGASGDLHGADALAGVVTIRSRTGRAVRALADAGSYQTARLSAYGGTGGLFGAAEGFTTDGFVAVAPESRGPIDTPAGSRHAAATAGGLVSSAGANWWIRTGHARERRTNGTPLQRNATGGTQASARMSTALSETTGWSAHGYVTGQDYEQSFSAVFAERTAERLTTEQDVDAVAVGGATTWSYSSGRVGLAATGAGRHVDGRLSERAAGASEWRHTRAEQTTAAVALQASTQLSGWTAGAGARAELWRSGPSGGSPRVFTTPRLWVAHRPAASYAWSAAYQSGYRPPTINELYRPFRVGSVLTDANAGLRPERARGFELGLSRTAGRSTARLAAFWNHVEDAIVNVTLATSDDLIRRQRQNAAAIRSSGAELELELRAARALVINAASSYTHARFSSGPGDGLRIPQVPEWQHAVGVRGRAGSLHYAGDWRFIGRQFDDDRNAFLLGRSSIVDARAGWTLRRGVELYAAVENLLDAEQDVGRTPLRTLGLPRTIRSGLRLVF